MAVLVDGSVAVDNMDEVEVGVAVEVAVAMEDYNTVALPAVYKQVRVRVVADYKPVVVWAVDNCFDNCYYY